jgi:hypothetical protein
MRIYAVREDKKKFIALQCDRCGIEAKPPIPREWLKMGTDHGPGTDKLEWDYCPDCAWSLNARH